MMQRRIFFNAVGVALAVVLGCLVHTVATAQVPVRVTGTHRFGPDTSEADACRFAVADAKRLAIEQVGGESIRADRLLVCKSPDEAGALSPGSPCRLSQTLWSELSGLLLEANVIQTAVKPYLGGRACTVEMAAVVALPNGQPDPSFDLTVALERPIYRVGEALRLTVTPTHRGYLTLFNWAPIEDQTAPLTRVLPADTATPLSVSGAGVFPSEGTRLEVGGFPIDPRESRWVPPSTWAEYLIVVYSRDPIEWPATLTLSEFGRKLHEIPRRDIRWQSHVFQVIQKPQLKKEALQ